MEDSEDSGFVEVLPPIAPVNRQLWENSPLRGSSVEEDSASNPNALFNSREPNFGIMHEKPEHRLIILLKAQGHSNVEIARLTGYTNVWIGQVLRQPWAKENLLRELSKGGQEEVQALLKGEAVDSVFTLISLRDTSDEDGVRLRAAQDLLDRHLGKATQHIEARSTVQHVSTEIGTLDKQLARLEAEERQLLGSHQPTKGPSAPEVEANS